MTIAKHEEALSRHLTSIPSWKELLQDEKLQQTIGLVENWHSQEWNRSIPGTKVDQDNKAKQLQAFQAWLENGMQAENVPFVVKDMGANGNGLVAKQDIPANSQLLKIPANLLITSTLNGKLDGLRNDPLCAQFPTVSLALNILVEALAPSSFFAPYIAVLPRNFHLPYYYSSNDFQALKASPSTYTTAIQLYYNSLRQYLYLRRVLPAVPGLPLSQFTLANYFWALGVALTRQNNVPTPGNPNSLALIPGWDMCNHSPGAMTTYANDNSIVCDAMKDFKLGEEITICYGPRPNSHFLIYSGFSIPINEHDVVPLAIPIAQDDALLKIRMLLLNKRKAVASNHSLSVQLSSNGQLASAFNRQHIQLLCLDKAHLTLALRQDEALMNAGEMVAWQSQDARTEANQMIHQACAAKVAELSAAMELQIHESIARFLANERSIYERAMQRKEFNPN